jgi:hypothetical protein
MEATLKAFERRNEDEKLVALLKGVLIEQYVIDTRKEIQDFLGTKSEDREQRELLAGLVNAALR